jgi:putative DNA primase/helicase
LAGFPSKIINTRRTVWGAPGWGTTMSINTTNAPPAQDYDLAAAYVAVIAGSVDATVDFRVIHDSDLGVYGQNKRGTLQKCWLWLCAMNDQGFGVFMVVAALDGAGQTMENVVALRCNYIDLDSAAAGQQYEIACRSHPAPTFAVQSSPGRYHVFWKTAEHTDKIRFSTVQRKLAAAFHGDRKVIDATRVLRVAGFFHRKSETPHLVNCWALSGYNTPTTIDTLEAALAHVTVPEGGNGTRKALGEGEQAPSLELLHRALDLIDPNDLDRNGWLGITTAVKQSGWTLTTPDALETLWLLWCARYEKNDVAECRKLWKSIDSSQLDWRTLMKRVPSLNAAVTFGTVPTVASSLAPDSAPSQQLMTPAEIALMQRPTNDDYAIGFRQQNAGRFLFNYDTRRWLEYDGRTWTERDPNYMLACIREFCRQNGGYEAKKPRTTSFWEGTLKALCADKELLVPQRAFDADRYLLNTPDGTIDLRTGDMRAHSALDMLTLCTTASPGLSDGTWDGFVDDITGRDRDTNRYLQLVMGSALSGGIEEQILPFLAGGGRNGKSVFVDTIRSVLGNYATTIASSALVETRNEQHSTGLTDFAGRRLCIGSEVMEGGWFNSHVLKMMTGDETVKARRMSMNFFEFPRTWRLVLVGNDLPQIRETNVAMKSRMRIVPFRQCYQGREDRTLMTRLAADGQGVLSWLLEGHRAWLAAGRQSEPSKAVAEATSAYFAAQSSPETWLDECADRIVPDDRTNDKCPGAQEIYRNYEWWKLARGEKPLSLTKFSPKLVEMGFTKINTNQGIRFRGLALKPVIIPDMPTSNR